MLVYDISLTGGAESVAFNMAEELSKTHKVHLISLFDQKGYSKDENKAYSVHVLNSVTVSIPTHIFSLSGKLRKVLKENSIDILFAITAGVVTVAVMATASLKTKTVYCEHSNLENKTYGKKHEIRQYIGAKCCNVVVALTERDRQNFVKKYGLAEDKVLAIPNWFVYDENSDHSYDANSKLIISAGRLEAVKGYDLLLEVAQKVKEKHPDWHWDIYGEGSLHRKLEQCISESGLNNFITLKGNVVDLNKRYKDYSMFVMTSYYEGLPLVLLEAQVANLPIISFDCPTGPGEIVEDGKNGFLVETYNTDVMSKKVNMLIENAKLRVDFSENSRLRIDNFSKESVIVLWLRLIERI